MDLRSLRESRNVILPGQYFDAETGKHVAYDLTYLRVWKRIGKRCLTVAMYGRRGNQERRP